MAPPHTRHNAHYSPRLPCLQSNSHGWCPLRMLLCPSTPLLELNANGCNPCPTLHRLREVAASTQASSHIPAQSKNHPQVQLVPSPLKGQTILLPCLKEMTKGPRPSFTHTWLHKSSRTRRHGMRKFQLHPSCCSMQSNLPLSWQELNEREELLEQQHVAIMMQPNNPHLTSYLTTTQTGC